MILPWTAEWTRIIEEALSPREASHGPCVVEMRRGADAWRVVRAVCGLSLSPSVREAIERLPLTAAFGAREKLTGFARQK